MTEIENSKNINLQHQRKVEMGIVVVKRCLFMTVP